MFPSHANVCFAFAFTFVLDPYSVTLSRCVLLQLDEPLVGGRSHCDSKIAMTNRHTNVVSVAVERGMLQG